MDNFQFEFIDVEIPDFSPEFFSLWLSKVVSDYDFKCGDLCYVFCTDDYLLDINKKHLKHDYFTDVITFNYNVDKRISGDVFISWDRVIDNSKEFGDGNVFNELCRVMVHGLLHLIGFNDKTDSEQLIMTAEETKNLIKR